MRTHDTNLDLWLLNRCTEVTRVPHTVQPSKGCTADHPTIRAIPPPPAHRLLGAIKCLSQPLRSVLKSLANFRRRQTELR